MVDLLTQKPGDLREFVLVWQTNELTIRRTSKLCATLLEGLSGSNHLFARASFEGFPVGEISVGSERRRDSRIFRNVLVSNLRHHKLTRR